MVEYMKTVATASASDLSLEERNLLYVAYKNAVGARRASLRIINSIEAKEKEKGTSNVPNVANYKSKVEEELNNICTDILDVRARMRTRDAGGAREGTCAAPFSPHPPPPPFCARRICVCAASSSTITSSPRRRIRPGPKSSTSR